MISRATIVEQLGLHHARLAQALEGVTDAEARAVVGARLAPIVWQVGHLAVVDATYVRRAGDPYEQRMRYEELFRPGTGVGGDYPPLAEVWSEFSRANDALLAVAAEADLDRPLTHPARAYTSVGGMLVYACYHRGYHVGKTGTLLALLGKALPAVPPAARAP